MKEKISDEEIKNFFDKLQSKKSDDSIADEDIKIFLEKITPNKDYLYLIQPFGFADILCMGGLSYAAQEKKNKSASVLIIPDKAKNWNISYENVADILYISQPKLLAIKKYLEENDVKEGENYIYGHFDPKEPKNYTIDEGLNLVDYYRKKVFDIPIDTPCRPPVITPLSKDEITNWNNRYTLDADRTVIISANIDPKDKVKFKFKFYEELIDNLNKKNYIVYSCIENFSNFIMPGTRPILANINEISYIARNVKCFIGENVGLLTLLDMTSEAHIFFINIFPGWCLDVSRIFSNPHSRTLYFIYDLIKHFDSELNADGLNFQWEFSHPKINSDEIFYSYEDVLENILSGIEKI